MKRLMLALALVGSGLSASAQNNPSSRFKSITLDAPLSAVNGGTGATNGDATGAIFPARNYGSCVWSNSGDVGPCVNAAISAAAAAGGGQVVVPAGVFGLATPVVQNNSGVGIVGQGVGDPRDSYAPGSFQAITRLLWLGAPGATMFDLEPAGNESLYKADVVGLVFDCNNKAAVCAKISQVSHSTIDIGVAEPIAIGAYITTNAGTDSPGTQDNDVWIKSRQTSTTATATGILIDGGPGSNWNPSMNRFHSLHAWYGAGDGIVFGNSDNNIVDHIGTFRQPGVATYGRSCVFANTGRLSPNGVAATAFVYDTIVVHNDCNDAKVFGPSSSGFARNIVFQFTDAANSVPDPAFDPYATGHVGRTDAPYMRVGNASQVYANFGYNNTVSATNMAVGNSNIATGNYSFAAGVGNTASYWSNFAFGQNNSATGLFSWSRGFFASDRGRSGADCWASGRFGVNGDAQACRTILRGSGSSAAAFRLTSDGAAASAGNCVNIPINAAYALRVTVQAFDHANSANAENWSGWTMMLVRGAGNAALTPAAQPAVLATGAVSGSSLSATADTANQCLNLSFTPPTGNSDVWNVVAMVESVEAQ